MSRRDPTLTPESEIDLVTRVKVDGDSEALTTLINQHTGIYTSVVNRYASTYPHMIRAADMDDDKMLNIYRFVMAYEPNRNMKLGTYICNRTDWLCKGLLKSESHNPLAMAVDSLPADDGNTESLPIPDESPGSRVTDIANADIGVDDIFARAKAVGTDRRFVKIVAYRNQDMSWRDIGRKLKVSHEWARKLYNQNIELIKSSLNPV